MVYHYLKKMLLGVFSTAVIFTSFELEAASKPKVPDFTKGDGIGEKHDWNLGATGLRGWMWGWADKTDEARQIYITKVDPSSPADGLIEEGDVILGFSGKKMDSDARMAMGEALIKADASGGDLSILIWRKGDEKNITLKLKALGKYTKTSPFKCKKSDLILQSGCVYIAKQMKNDFQDHMVTKEKSSNTWLIMNCVNNLALMASGDEQYLDLVKNHAHIYTQEILKTYMDRQRGMESWIWGYANLFLCEYYLLTKDKTVLPAIEKLTNNIAKGQSAVGTWGHTMAWPADNEGKKHGILGGYGALNAAGLICQMSMALADRCGITNPEIKKAIKKGNAFFSFYKGKGAIPYGDHLPVTNHHDDNGKNSMAALVFDLQNMDDETRFFTSMSIASHAERERGHTGNYFSLLWGPLAARRAGENAPAAFMKQQRWFYDLNRSWDGSFTYQGKANAGGGENSYRNWDSTSAFMLAYALPLKKLYITGKGSKPNNILKPKALSQVIAAGVISTPSHYKEMSLTRLYDNLGSWSPAVRHRSAEELAERKDDTEAILDVLNKKLKKGTRNERYGACITIRFLGERASSTVENLIPLLSEDDFWTKAQAITALTNIGAASREAIPLLLELSLKKDSYNHLDYLQGYLAFGLFDFEKNLGRQGLIKKSLDDVNRDLLLKVVERILTHPNGRMRYAVTSVYENLTYEELQPILPSILKSITEPSPSGVMFSYVPRINGLKLLSKYKVKEGIEMTIEFMAINKWGKSQRLSQGKKILLGYDRAARLALPGLRKLKQTFISEHQDTKKYKNDKRTGKDHLGRWAKEMQDLIDEIEKIDDSITMPELKSLPSFKDLER